jgi:hypothetical protein
MLNYKDIEAYVETDSTKTIPYHGYESEDENNSS